jgi:hypothetical protein
MGVALTEAIDRLYVAFAAETKPADIHACPCCVSREQVAALLGPEDLRALPAETVADYASHAITTVGSASDFRYFLPRLLQLAVTEGFDWPDLEIAVGRLRLAGWTGWEPDQQRAVRDVLRALWDQTLRQHPVSPDADTVLCAIGNAEDDLTPYLAAWAFLLRTGDAAPAEHLSDLLNWSARVENGRWRLRNAFWNRRDGQVSEWLAAGSTRAAVLAGFDAATSEPALTALADIAALI